MRIPKKRRLENRTNYQKRKRLLEGKKPRISIRKTNKYIILQYIESQQAQDYIKTQADSKQLLKYGWPKERIGSLKSLGASYLTGLFFGKKIKEFAPAILDTGLIRSTKGSRIYSAVKGIIDAGYKIPCKEEMFPQESRIKSDKIANFDKIKQQIMNEK